MLDLIRNRQKHSKDINCLYSKNIYLNNFLLLTLLTFVECKK